MTRQAPRAGDTFLSELEDLINHHSRENDSGTPDFILAQYLDACLAGYATAVTARDRWYGWTPRIGGIIEAVAPRAADSDVALSNSPADQGPADGVATAYMNACQEAQRCGEPLPDVHEFTEAWRAEHG